MYIVLRIKCLQKYVPINREAAHEFHYVGIYQTIREVEECIEQAEFTMDYIAHTAGQGITIYTVGDMPDYYIVLDEFRLPEYPMYIARLTVQ